MTSSLVFSSKPNLLDKRVHGLKCRRLSSLGSQTARRKEEWGHSRACRTTASVEDWRQYNRYVRYQKASQKKGVKVSWERYHLSVLFIDRSVGAQGFHHLQHAPCPTVHAWLRLRLHALDCRPTCKTCKALCRTDTVRAKVAAGIFDRIANWNGFGRALYPSSVGMQASGKSASITTSAGMFSVQAAVLECATCIHSCHVILALTELQHLPNDVSKLAQSLVVQM